MHMDMCTKEGIPFQLVNRLRICDCACIVKNNIVVLKCRIWWQRMMMKINFVWNEIEFQSCPNRVKSYSHIYQSKGSDWGNQHHSIFTECNMLSLFRSDIVDVFFALIYYECMQHINLLCFSGKLWSYLPLTVGT